jgi:thiosulfate/3-mercaptopyruvate sulfurtransferase
MKLKKEKNKNNLGRKTKMTLRKRLMILGLAGVLSLGVVGCTSTQPKEEKQATEVTKEVNKYEQYVQTDNIISPKDAKALLDKGENVVAVDIRKDVDYALGHIEGAVNIWRPDFEDKNAEVEGMAAPKEQVEKLLGEKVGADNKSTILLYDNAGEMDAARFWWMLDMYGYDNVKLIDGGIDGWKAAGFETTLKGTEVNAKEFKFPEETDNSKLATIDEVKAALEDENTIILDARSIEEATGKDLKKGAFRKGRVPNSTWLEYKQAIAEDMSFKTTDELKKMYEEKGITKDKNIIVYCQSGVRSAHTTFVLTELLGYENVKNFDGSWIEWSYNKELPLETGEVK